MKISIEINGVFIDYFFVFTSFLLNFAYVTNFYKSIICKHTINQHREIMKTRVFYIFGFVVFATILAMTSCRDQDFDFEEAYRANPIVEFEHNFETIFGKIAPDQSWDFSGYGDSGTRADATPTVEESTDWYYVEDNTLKHIQTTLNAGIPHADEGEPFAFAVPESGEMTVYPIYQGTGMSWELHMVVDGEDTAINGFWQKGKTVEGNSSVTALQKNKGKACSKCSGTGLVADSDNSVTWNNNVFAISKWWFTAGTKYLSGEGSSFPRICKRSDNVAYFAVVQYKGDNYLYYLDINNPDNNGFVTVNNNKISIEKTYSTGAIVDQGCINAGNLKLNNDNRLIIGGKKIGVIGGLVAWFSSWFGEVNYLVARDQNASNGIYSFDWAINQKSYDHKTGWNYDFTDSQRNNIKNSIDALNGKKICPDCDNGKIVDPDGWINVNGGTFKNDNTNSNNTLDALAVRTRGYKFTGLKPGASVYFYAKVTEGVSLDGKTYGTTGDVFVSTGNYMIKLNNAPSINNLGDKTAALCAFEDFRDDNNIGKDKDGRDFESLVFLVVSDQTTSTPYNSDGSLKVSNEIIQKRYMVEDLGAVESSDIDFNDVVFDLSQESEYKLVTNETNKTVSPIGMSKNLLSSSQNAIVRAMGGTLDFDIYVGTTKIFNKSESGKTVGTMYNTERKNINYQLDLVPPISLPTNPWNPSENNVSCRIYKKNETYSDATTINGNTYDIVFPRLGEVPNIIAFDVTKEWRDERHQICNNWLLGKEDAQWEWPEPHDQDGDMTYEKWLEEYGNQSESN